MPGCTQDEVEERLLEHADAMYGEREEQFGSEEMRTLERLAMLRIMDTHWVHHLTAIQEKRQGIGLQAFGQRDPLVMYKREGHEMFQSLLARIQHDIVHTIYHTGLEAKPAVRRVQNPQAPAGGRQAPAGARKVGRNDPCPCGSGKKYKRCHGVAA